MRKARKIQIDRKAVLPTLLQERVALDDSAKVQASQAGHCPRDGSDRIYLDLAA